MSYDRTTKQTNRDYNSKYIDMGKCTNIYFPCCFGTYPWRKINDFWDSTESWTKGFKEKS